MEKSSAHFRFQNIKPWFVNLNYSNKMLALSLIFLLPLLKWLPIIICFTFIIGVVENFHLDFSLRLRRLNGISLGMVILFTLYLLGMLWTENLSQGWRMIEYKMSLLLMPFFFMHFKSKIEYKEWLYLFLVSLILNCLILFGFAAFRTWNVGWTEGARFWKESDFSFYMHRSYLACYMSMGALLILWLYLQIKRKVLLIPFLIFTGVIILTASKAGLIVLFLGILTITLRFVWLNLDQSRIRWISLLFVLSLFLLITTNQVVRIRFDSAWKSFFSAEIVNNKSKDSTEARVMMWSASWQIIQDNFWKGVGTGDADDELQKVNIDRNNLGVAHQKLNSHNQFLTLFLQLGIVGFIFFSAWLIYFFLSIWRRRDAVSFVIISVFAVNFLFESFLETRAGILPFCWLLLSLNAIDTGSDLFKFRAHEGAMV
jgi:O-antigen ligase